MNLRFWIGLSAVTAGILAWRKMKRPPARHFHLDLPDGGEANEDGSVLFIGTATTLIRYGGLTILTDPNFLRQGQQVHIGYGMHSTRLTNPSMNFEDLPHIDFVLLSHLHEDHFDKLVEQRLPRHTPILTTPSAAATLKERGFLRATGLKTWDQVHVRKGATSLKVTSMPGRHGPMLVSAAMPSVMGSMLEFERDDGSYRMYVSGDTLVVPRHRRDPAALSPRRFGVNAPGRHTSAWNPGDDEREAGHRSHAHHSPRSHDSDSLQRLRRVQGTARGVHGCSEAGRDGRSRPVSKTWGIVRLCAVAPGTRNAQVAT